MDNIEQSTGIMIDGIDTLLTQKQVDVLLEIRKVQTEIMEEIKRICSLADLNYFLMFGTLLGAIRHNGFIPWDDDVDLGMLREDFNKFLIAFEKHASSEFAIQSLDSDPFYAFFFIKVVRKNTTLIEGGYQDNRKNNNIFVDIFPFDNAPRSSALRYLQNKSAIFMKSLLFYKLDRINLKEGSFKIKVAKRIKKIISVILSRNIIIKLANWIMTSVKAEGDWISNFGDKKYYPSILFKEFEDLKFNESDYTVPKNPENLLNYFYGNFMDLPPLNKRTLPHDIISVTIDGEKIL